MADYRTGFPKFLEMGLKVLKNAKKQEFLTKFGPENCLIWGGFVGGFWQKFSPKNCGLVELLLRSKFSKRGTKIFASFQKNCGLGGMSNCSESQ